ncbi:MAG: flagella basal body P-ring formation protein FlgA [Rhodospirillaceae bacterium]|nr:MAG: flagella basal body P-ring formation protein FlgA [Rhodospirillaceae bacterium]
MIKRITRTLLFLAVCVVLTPAVWAKPILQEHALIEGDIIHLGDLFKNAGDKADIAIAKAPAPGARIVLDAKRLTSIARAYKFPWRASSRFAHIIVERSGKPVPQEAIETALKKALREQGALENMLIALSSRESRVYVPMDRLATVAVKHLEYNKRSQFFSAILVSPANDSFAKEFRVSGKAHATVLIPVLRERADHGDILRKRNIQWVRMRTDRIGSNVVTTTGDLIGNTPRRMILAGKPIQKNEVRQPILVEKGKLVMMTYNTPYMTLTMKGRAMDKGSRNDMVRVMNVHSKTVVDAIVMGPNKVSAYAFDTVAMQGETRHVR